MMNSVLFILLLVYITACDTYYYDTNDGIKGLRQGEVRYQYMRCTRRFSPGACSTPIRPVWTFAFPLQNCTERIGCPHDPRANRFMSYSRCMDHCQSLIDLYTHILASGNNNITMLRSGVNYSSSRREEGFSQISLYEEKEMNYDPEDDDTQESLNFLEVGIPDSDDIHDNIELGNVDSHDM